MASRVHGWWLIAATAVTSSAWGQALMAPRAPLVFRGVTVIDVREGRHLPDQVVMIAGHRIQAVGTGKAVAVPRGARVVDARGKYLIPGLWDLHVHPMQYADIAYPLFVANGVTGVRDAGSNVPLATLGRWKQEIAAGTRVGPRLIVSGQAVDGAGGETCQKTIVDAHHICVATPAEARLAVDLLHTAGADMLKTYSLSPELYFAVAAEARRIGIPFGGHADVGGLVASDSGANILDHMTWFKPDVCGSMGESAVPQTASLEACTAAAQRLRRNRTWVTLMASPTTRADLDSQYMPRPLAPAVLQAFSRVVTDTTKSPAGQWMHAAGIPFVVGTDAVVSAEHSWFFVPGFSVAELLAGLVRKAGYTPLEALQAATLNAVSALRLTDSLGTVAAGQVADLVLLDADPLADIGNTAKVRAVVANGRYYDRAALDGMLRAAAAETRRVRAAAAPGAP